MGEQSVTVRVVNFKNGPRYARVMGGRFDPASKTWTIPANRPELGALGAYGLALVKGAGVASARNPICRSCGTYCDGDCRYDV